MAKPAWLIPKKKPKLSPMSNRNVVRRHLKEWNFDDDGYNDEDEDYLIYGDEGIPIAIKVGDKWKEVKRK